MVKMIELPQMLAQDQVKSCSCPGCVQVPYELPYTSNPYLALRLITYLSSRIKEAVL